MSFSWYPATAKYEESLARDDVNVIRRIPVQTIVESNLLQTAVYLNAIQCVKFLITVPGIDMNEEKRMKGVKKYSPFTVAITRLMGIENLTDEETECACILARDHRVDCNVVIDVDMFKYNPMVGITFIQFHAEPSHNRLLIEMVRNPSIDVNKMYALQFGPEPDMEENEIENKHSFFVHAMQKGREDLFYEMLKDPKLDLSIGCTVYGRTALHYAVERNLHFAVRELVRMMPVDVINAVTTTQNRCSAIKIWPSTDDSEHPQLLMPIAQSPKLKIEDDILGNFINMYVTYNTLHMMMLLPAPTVTCRATSRRRSQACIDLVGALLDNPNFDMMDAVNGSAGSPFHKALQCPDDKMFVKLLNWDKLEGRHMRAKENEEGGLIDSLLIWAMSQQDTPFKLTVFKKMLEFADIRDEIARTTNEGGMTAVHMAVHEERDEILQLLLATTTDKPLSVLAYPLGPTRPGRRPLKMATELYSRKCRKIIDHVLRDRKKKFTMTKSGYVADSC